MKFLLTGGGDFEFFTKVDQQFEEILRKNDQILILPYASDPEDFEDIFSRTKESYGNGPAKPTFAMLKDITKLKESDLLDTAALFIEGGNTFDLITAVRDANIATYFKSFSQQHNKVIYADSAGAIILGASVKTAFLGDDADEDAERLQDYRGLNILNEWAVHAHYSPEDDDGVMSLVYDEGIPVLGLYEETGIYISDNNELKVLTHAPVILFTAAGKQLIDNHKLVNLSDFY